MSHRSRALTALVASCLIPVAASAVPPTVALMPSGGWTYTTKTPWAGLDLALHHDGDRGFTGVGRLRLQWGFRDMRPQGSLEAGFAGVVPTENKATIRVGMVVGSEVYVATYAMRLLVPGQPQPGTYGSVGFLPYGEALADMGWIRDGTKGPAAWTVGLRAGLGLTVNRAACPEAPNTGCTGPALAFRGGITGRLKFHEGAYLEALAGPSPHLAVGYGW